MNKKLPQVFANKIGSINNNTKVAYGYDNIKKEEKLYRSEASIELSIEQKINRIFDSPNYVYKIKVNIETEKDKLTKVLIGRTNEDLITIDNELIPIKNIKDIYI